MPPTVSRLAQIVLLSVVYYATAKLSLMLAIPPGYASPVWPPSGIALAAILLLGRQIWPGIWVGAALVNLTVQGSPLLALLIATGNTLEAVVAAALISRYADRLGRFDTAEDVVKFIALSALSAMIAALAGVSSLALLNVVPWTEFVANGLIWWQGDTAGMIVVTPLILSWWLTPPPRWPLVKAIEAAVLACSVIFGTHFIFSFTTGDGAAIPLAFAALPFIIWAAIRFGQREVTAAIAIVFAIAIWHTARQHGPFAAAPPHDAALVLLAYASTLVITGLVLNAVLEVREQRIAIRTKELEAANRALQAELAERLRKEETLRQSEERFRVLVDGVKDYAIFMLDPNGRVVSWNAGAEHIKGYHAPEIIGSHFSRFYTPEDLARNWPEHALKEAREKGRFEDENWRMRKDGSRFLAHVIICALYDSERRLLGFTKVTRDLTARRRLETLQENERQINEFLAMLSHELRNPLAPIVNALSLMRNKLGSQHAELQNIIERQVAHLARIVDDLLDVSRITRGKIVLKKETVAVNDIVSHAIESCQPLITARNHKVEWQIPDQKWLVFGDPTRLLQAVVNLINNAAKYTPQGGLIRLALESEDGEVVLRVRDSGIGISSAMLPKIFDLFVQGDISLDRTEGGLGIGLTLVKRIAQMHDGSVAVYSDGAGQGSEFVLRLPLAKDAGMARLAAPPAGGVQQSVRRRILLVDDNRDFADTMAALLEAMGHEVRTAYDGPAAISVAAEYRPDTMLLDIGLPGMSGYEVARHMKNSSKLSSIKLIALSGYGQDDDKRRVREAGFDYHLVKPVEPDELTKIFDALASPAQDGSRAL